MYRTRMYSAKDRKVNKARKVNKNTFSGRGRLFHYSSLHGHCKRVTCFFFFFFFLLKSPVTLCSGELWSILVVRLQRARASKNGKNFSQPADVLKIRKKQAAFFEANVLITDRPRSFPRVREVFRLLQIGCTRDLRSWSAQANCMQAQAGVA